MTAPVVATPAHEFGKNRGGGLGPLLTPSDDDGDPVALTITACPKQGTLIGAHGELLGCPVEARAVASYVPDQNFAGVDSIGVTADDGYGAHAQSLIQAFEVRNSPPVFDKGQYSINAELGREATAQFVATDADPGDVVRYELGSIDAAIRPYVSVSPDGVILVALPDDVALRGVRSGKARITALDESLNDLGVKVAAVDNADLYLTIAPRLTPTEDRGRSDRRRHGREPRDRANLARSGPGRRHPGTRHLVRLGLRRWIGSAHDVHAAHLSRLPHTGAEDGPADRQRDPSLHVGEDRREQRPSASKPTPRVCSRSRPGAPGPV